MAITFSRTFDVPLDQMSIYACGDSADWDEVVGDKENLTEIVNGHGDCSSFGEISVALSLDIDIVKALGLFFADACTMQEGSLLMPTKVALGENGIFVSIATSKPQGPDKLLSLMASPVGQFINSFFKSIFGCTAKASILVDNTDTLNRLLKAYGVGISGAKANKMLVKNGLLEEREETNTIGKMKKFKALTDQGMQYGYNMTSESQVIVPQFYALTFEELIVKYLNK